MRSGVAAHGTRADDGDPFGHLRYSQLVPADPNLRHPKFIAQSRSRSVRVSIEMAAA
jgi:hypothetical protein